MEKTDRWGHKPVVFAVLQGCTEVVQLLLRAGCSFDLGTYYRLYTYDEKEDILTFAVRLLQIPTQRLPVSVANNDYFEIVKVIIEELVLRRRSLMSAMIDASLVYHSGVSDCDQILDSGTAQAEISLQNANKLVPRLRSTLSSIHTVYHCPLLTVKIANELWNVGFREIDVPDDHGKTPLMMQCVAYPTAYHSSLDEFMDIAFWLYQEGAFLCRSHRAMPQQDSNNAGNTVPRPEQQATHFIVAALKWYVVQEAVQFWFCFKQFEKLSTLPYTLLMDESSLDCQHFLQKVMLDKSPDGCLCACSSHGCLPVVYFLKDAPLEPFTEYYRRNEVREKFIRDWKFRSLFDNVPSKHFPVALKRDIVRLMTFGDLGLRHTCCRYDLEYRDFWIMDREEADEIRDEDCEGIQLLESLIVEFEEKLGDGDIKLFLVGYWSAKMKEVLAARDNEPVDEAGMREAGVVIRELDGNFNSQRSGIHSNILK